MSYFPFFVDIENKTFLVVVGGRIATEKIRRLFSFSASVVVVAKETAISDEWGCEIRRKTFEEEDLEGMDFCIAATGNADTDECIASACRKRQIPINVADRPGLCDFILPAFVKKGDLVVAVSTSGASPGYAGRLRDEIADQIPENIESVLEEMQRLRRELKQEVGTQKERAAILRDRLEELLAGIEE